MSDELNGRHPSTRSTAGIVVCVAVGALLCNGCFGYLLGWSDAEVDRMQRIVAELEAKNASLVDENIELRAKVRQMQDGPGQSEGKSREPLRSSHVGTTSDTGDSQCQN
jgi:cell division protein FtsB